MNRAPARRIFYGWYIVVVCFITISVAFGARYTFSTFFVELNSEFHWSRQEIAGVFSVCMIFFAAFSLPVGILLDKMGPRLLYPVGALSLALTFALSSRVTELWQLYAAYALPGAFGMVALGASTHAATIARWFQHKRATAIALAMAGMNVGVVTIPPLAERFIAAYGWRSTYLALGAMLAFGVAPLAWAFHRPDPSEQPRRDTADALSDDQSRFNRVEVRPHQHDWTLSMAARTLNYWMLMVAAMLMIFTGDMLSIHLVPYLVDSGQTREHAVWAYSLQTATGTVGFLLWAWLSDRLGRRTTYVAGNVFMVGGLIGLTQVQAGGYVWFVLMSVALIGFGNGIFSIFQALVGDSFHGNSVGAIFGTIGLAYGIGGALGPWFGGFAFDVLGSYRWGFAGGAIASTVCAVLVAATARLQSVPPVAPLIKAKQGYET